MKNILLTIKKKKKLKTGSVADDGDSVDEPKKDEPKQTSISKTGGFGGDDKPKTPSADDYDSVYGTRNQTGGGFQKSRDDSDDGGDIDRSKSYDGKVDDEPKEAPSAVNPDLKSQFTDEELEDVPFGHRKDGSFNDKTEEMEQEISMELEQLYGVDEDGEYDDDMAELVRQEAELLYAEYGGTKGNIIPDEFQTLKGYRDKLMKNIENRIAMKEKKPYPHKTGSSYFEKKPEKKNRGTMGSVGVREPGQAGSGMYDSVQPKKKPFLKEQLERIGGGKY